jgi:hypothetical protein
MAMLRFWRVSGAHSLYVRKNKILCEYDRLQKQFYEQLADDYHLLFKNW